MIGFILIFALGFLAAAMLAMFITPAIYGRVVKLTEKRIEATVPTSHAEIKSKADLMRARFASETAKLSAQLRMERDKNTANTLKANQLQTDLARISGEKSQAVQTIEELLTQCATLRSDTRKNEQVVEKLSGSVAELERIKRLDDAQISHLRNVLASISTDVESMKIDLATSGTETMSLRSEIDTLRMEKNRLLSDIKEITDTAVTLERDVQNHQEDHDERRIALAAAQSMLADREMQLEQANALIDDQQRQLREGEEANQLRMRDLEEAEMLARDLSGQLETLKAALDQGEAEKTDLKEKITELRAESRQMSKEIKLATDLAEDIEQRLAEEQRNAANLKIRLDKTETDLKFSEQQITKNTRQSKDDSRELSEAAATENRQAQAAEKRVAALESQIRHFKLELEQSHQQSAEFSNQLVTMDLEARQLSTSRASATKAEVMKTDSLPDAPLPVVERDLNGMMKSRVEEIRQRHARLVESLRQSRDSSTDASMRDEIAAIAATIVGLSGQRDGKKSPIHAILSDAGTSKRPSDARLSLAARAKSELQD
ncbi:MAG: hypothetical protein P1V21_21765 [Rhizobiaceae bacterium]|nr:hypothetical protein [Rhizobiaceae bacterium]